MTETVTRRTAMKAAAGVFGAGLLPSWLLERRHAPLDLTPFCDEEEWFRYDLRQPFLQSDWTYATDGRICVRVRPSWQTDRGPDCRLPNAGSLPWDHDGLTGWQPWPGRSYVPYVPYDRYGECGICLGVGRMGEDVVQCPRCGGPGWIETDDFYEAPCKGCEKQCGWIGGVACHACEGRGYGGQCSAMVLGEALISPKYDQKIRTLTDIEYTPPTAEEEPIRFRAQGVYGILMPLRRD